MPEDMREENDAFLSDYLSFGDIFSESEADLAPMNERLMEYYEVFTGAENPEQGETAGWDVKAIYVSMGKRHDYRDSLQAVKAPDLVAHGAEDIYQPKGASRSYAGAFLEAESRLVEDAGHFPCYAQPDLFARIVGEFLGES